MPHIPDNDIKSVQCIKSEKFLPMIGRESSLEKRHNENVHAGVQAKQSIGSFKVRLALFSKSNRGSCRRSPPATTWQSAADIFTIIPLQCSETQ